MKLPTWAVDEAKGFIARVIESPSPDPNNLEERTRDIAWMLSELNNYRNVVRDLRQKLAIAGVEGSPPLHMEGTIPMLRRQLRELQEKMAVACRETPGRCFCGCHVTLV